MKVLQANMHRSKTADALEKKEIPTPKTREKKIRTTDGIENSERWMLSGHSYFRKYLHKMGKAEEPSCIYNDATNDAQVHKMAIRMYCTRKSETCTQIRRYKAHDEKYGMPPWSNTKAVPGWTINAISYSLIAREVFRLRKLSSWRRQLAYDFTSLDFFVGLPETMC